jgi:hypothetical protein
MNLTAVITTVQKPTASVVNLIGRLGQSKLIVIGDAGGPEEYPGADLWTLDAQWTLAYRLSLAIPQRKYSRKNIGYLLAMQARSRCIYETDDDNAPISSWKAREPMVTAPVARQTGWVNPYLHFTKRRIWPRGLPLDAIDAAPLAGKATARWCPIQQGLANGAPDVDAIYRLAIGTKPVVFAPGRSIVLPASCWSPFNSQSTWWWPEAYPLMYLPSYCSFRLTDIWRSFVAQRCLWQMRGTVAFHSPEVKQDRNRHNLVDDFNSESQGYLFNSYIRKVLSDITLDKYPEDNLLMCYRAIVRAGLLPKEELRLVKLWLADLAYVRANR